MWFPRDKLFLPSAPRRGVWRFFFFRILFTVSVSLTQGYKSGALDEVRAYDNSRCLRNYFLIDFFEFESNVGIFTEISLTQNRKFRVPGEVLTHYTLC